MKIKKDKKSIFWFSVAAIICFIGSKVLGIVNHDYNTMDTIMDILMLVVVVRCLMIGCIEKNNK